MFPVRERRERKRVRSAVSSALFGCLKAKKHGVSLANAVFLFFT
jgi:hypothetical protein